MYLNSSFIYSNGVQIPLSSMDRNVFANLYEIAIMGSLEEHEEVLLDIKYAKDKATLEQKNINNFKDKKDILISELINEKNELIKMLENIKKSIK